MPGNNPQHFHLDSEERKELALQACKVSVLLTESSPALMRYLSVRRLSLL